MFELEKYKGQEELTLHLEAIQFYNSRLQENDLFRSAVIVGSFAKGCPDWLSDIDLVTFVDDGKVDESFRYLVGEEPFPVVHSFAGTHETRFSYKKYIFDNYVSAEIHVAAKSTPFRLRRPFIALFDRDSFLDDLIEDGEPPMHENFPALNLGEKGMAWELHDLVKWWARGRKEFVKNHIKKLAKRIDELDGPL